MHKLVPSCLLFSLCCANVTDRGTACLGAWMGGGGGGGGTPPEPEGGGGGGGGALDG